MKLKWFVFNPAPDGFDILVRDTGADNGDIIAEVGVRGDDFKRLVDEVLFEGLNKLNPPEEKEALPESTAEDWADEPDSQADGVADVEDEEPEGEEVDLTDEINKLQ